ncbi:hypothetical protein EQV77_06335 [Halobacillus fulvus]|nr:hypothetical protein EQV77_06335 [Halobacillus fulvus]
MKKTDQQKFVQRKYRKELAKKEQDKDAHISLMLIVGVVLILAILALYFNVFPKGVRVLTT